jgi:1-acyl-sn-glycerol-3-phosphate acyltransferase
VKQRLAIWALRCRGWRLAGEAPRLPKYLVLFGPHTCNWDFPLAMLAIAGFGIRPQWLGKHTIFRWPVAGLLRRMGGIPVRRDSREGVVGQIAAAYGAADSLAIGMTPEGTRSPGRYWKSGFYHLARAAGVPVVLASIDEPTRRITIGPTLDLTGAVRADMDRIRAFYAPMRGIHPHKASVVRIREEGSGGGGI